MSVYVRFSHIFVGKFSFGAPKNIKASYGLDRVYQKTSFFFNLFQGFQKVALWSLNVMCKIFN